MGNCNKKPKDGAVSDPGNPGAAAAKGDAESDSDTPEVEGAVGHFGFEAEEQKINAKLSGNSHPTLNLRTAAQLSKLLTKSIDSQHPQLSEGVKEKLSDAELHDINITFNVHSDPHGKITPAGIMNFHGLSHVERFAEGESHPSQIFADRLFAHYNLESKTKDRIDPVDLATGYSNLCKSGGNTHVSSVFQMYNITGDKSGVTKADFRTMTISLISSAALSPDFRMKSLELGVHHMDAQHNEEIMEQVDWLVNLAFARGKEVLTKSEFEKFMDHMKEENLESAPDPDDRAVPPLSPAVAPRSAPALPDDDDEEESDEGPATNPEEPVETLADVMKQLDEVTETISHIPQPEDESVEDSPKLIPRSYSQTEEI